MLNARSCGYSPKPFQVGTRRSVVRCGPCRRAGERRWDGRVARTTRRRALRPPLTTSAGLRYAVSMFFRAGRVAAAVSGAVFALLLVAACSRSGSGSDGCAKDNDCKGDRVCERGACVERPASGGPVTVSPVVVSPTTPGVQGCGECTWTGTACLNGTCSLRRDVNWVLTPAQTTIPAPRMPGAPLNGTDFGFPQRRRYDVKTCFRPTGTVAWTCTSEAALGPPDASGQFVRASYNTQTAPAIKVGVDQMINTGVDLRVFVNGSLLSESLGVRHATGLRATRLLFEGGLAFRTPGTRVDRVTFQLRAEDAP